MNCPKCNQVVEDNSRFCRFCGATISSAPSATPSPSVAPPADKPLDTSRDPAQEKQIWQGRTAWRSFYGTWALWAILSFACLIGIYRATTPSSPVRTAVWLLALAAGVVLFVRQALIIFGVRYRLTTQRLFVHRGVLTRVTDQTELVRVDDVRLRQGVFDRLLNTGDVEVISSDKTDEDLTLHSIDAPAEVAENIRRYVRTARGKGTLFVENV